MKRKSNSPPNLFLIIIFRLKTLKRIKNANRRIRNEISSNSNFGELFLQKGLPLINVFQKCWAPIKNANHWILEIRYIRTEAYHKQLHCNHFRVMDQIFWQFHKYQCDEHHQVQNWNKLQGKVYIHKGFWKLISRILLIYKWDIKPWKKSPTISKNVQCNLRDRDGVWIANNSLT